MKQKLSDVNRRHFTEIASHLLNNDVDHGHYVGSPSGGPPVPSDAHLQDGAYVPQGIRQYVEKGGAPMDDAVTRDYGIADDGAGKYGRGKLEFLGFRRRVRKS